MYPGHFAARTPEKPAAIASASGASVTYAELDKRSAVLAGYLHAQGLRHGDAVAVFLENNLAYFDVAWAALRSGLYMVTVSRHATADDAAYMVRDSGAKAIVSSVALIDLADACVAETPECTVRLLVGAQTEGWHDYEATLAAATRLPAELERKGDHMPYSSGTTGRPKGSGDRSKKVTSTRVSRVTW